jgi:PBP1b-binding outer membrane lipoprotein LpoB
MKKTLQTITAVILLALIFSSCSTRSGYGCKGRESWGNMVKRINRP